MRLSHFLKIHLNIILPSTPRFFKWSNFLRLHQQNLVWTSRSLNNTLQIWWSHIFFLIKKEGGLKDNHYWPPSFHARGAMGCSSLKYPHWHAARRCHSLMTYGEEGLSVFVNKYCRCQAGFISSSRIWHAVGTLQNCTAVHCVVCQHCMKPSILDLHWDLGAFSTMPNLILCL
jgi:hypothetical protein